MKGQNRAARKSGLFGSIRYSSQDSLRPDVSFGPRRNSASRYSFISKINFSNAFYLNIRLHMSLKQFGATSSFSEFETVRLFYVFLDLTLNFLYVQFRDSLALNAKAKA